MDIAGLAPPVLHAALARLSFTSRMFNLTITNVPGAQQPLYAFGAPVQRVVPFVPLFSEHTVGIAAVSYDGKLTFGICADRVTVPDIDELERGVEESLAELVELASEKAALGGPARDFVSAG